MPNDGDKKGDKPANDQDLFRDLHSFRKETLVNKDDQAKWKEEANRALRGNSGGTKVPTKEQEEEQKKEKEGPSRWERIQKQERKKAMAGGMLAICALVIIWQLNLGGRLRGLFSPKPKATPTPAATPQAPAHLPPDTVRLAEAFLVCRWELAWVAPRVEFKNIGEDPFRYDWSTVEGPASMFSPSRHTDPLDRFMQIAAGDKIPPRALLLNQLAVFIRSAAHPSDKVLSAAFTDDPGLVRDRAAAALPGLDKEAAARVSLAAGLAELEAGGDPEKARPHFARAAADSPADDPWPARALALLDTTRGKPEDAVKALEARHAASPTDETNGFQLVWLLVQAGKTAQGDKVLEKLETLPKGEVARLLRATQAASAGEWARFDALKATIDTDLPAKPAPFRARWEALKAQALLSRDPNQTQLAREMLLKTYEMDKSCTWADLSLARLTASQKLWPEAASSYRRYLRRFPTWIKARRELAGVLAQGQYFAQALGEYTELLMVDGPKDDYRKGIQFAAAGLNRPDIARYLLDRANQLAPK